jgi:predicted nucleotidyltransferase
LYQLLAGGCVTKHLLQNSELNFLQFEVKTVTMSPIVQNKREDILRIAAQYGASNIRVFGSVARGEAGPESDIDVLIHLESGRSLLDIVAIKQDLEELLGRKVDVLTESSISPYLRDHILRDAIEL